MPKDVIIACDFSGKEEALTFLDKFTGESLFVKVGMELYYAEGPEIIREIKKRNHKIFLDLKLHDIPNTVKKAMKALSRLDIDMCNLHAAGGSGMMKAAVEGLTADDGSRPVLIAVTQLTSTDEDTMKKELLIERPLEEVVISYAQNAKSCGLDGIVCSPLESNIVHAACGHEFLTITPGVRFEDSERGDQSRITTPARARELGSDYIVVGRPITAAADPIAAYRRCMKDFVG
ncbi:MAG: orotidine-5'-phosphate decarboxylase [Eubacteriales bacterium]|nr:orotidine-5'-phosphate decarboxylase [Eubacteriales bacterium]